MPFWFLQCFVASKKTRFSDKKMLVCIRSYKELLRWMQFAEHDNVFYQWLRDIKSEEILWDVGASNGFEGFYAQHHTGCKVVFIEPFTPSIESVMKTTCLLKKRTKLNGSKIEIVQAACSQTSSFGKLITHTKPVAGENYNSVSDKLDLYCQGGRNEMDQSISQWLSFITLDELHAKHGIALPTHLKIDVDGLELIVLKGADSLLESPSLKTCVIEVNDDNTQKVIDLMMGFSFEKVSEFVHVNQCNKYTADYIFRRSV